MIAQPSLFNPPATRKPCLQDALDLLYERGSLGVTSRDFLQAKGRERLAARVAELRDEFGQAYVTTIYEGNSNGGRHARYILSAYTKKDTPSPTHEVAA